MTFATHMASRDEDTMWHCVIHKKDRRKPTVGLVDTRGGDVVRRFKN